MDTSRCFSDLIRQHARLSHKVAYAYCRNATDREDVVQEVAVQLWRPLPDYDGRCKESTWVYRITLNVAIYVKPWARRLMDALSGRSLRLAAGHLAELSRFEREDR